MLKVDFHTEHQKNRAKWMVLAIHDLTFVMPEQNGLIGPIAAILVSLV